MNCTESCPRLAPTRPIGCPSSKPHIHERSTAMLHLKRVLPTLACLIGLIVAPASHAQWAVVDVGAITQLIQEVSYWKQQIQAMSSQPNQLQSTYNAMTGNRGMQNLLPMSPQTRNYLPPDWQGLIATLNGLSGSYRVLATQLNSTLTANAILT